MSRSGEIGIIGSKNDISQEVQIYIYIYSAIHDGNGFRKRILENIMECRNHLLLLVLQAFAQ